jgi:hypothetical protein
MKGTEQLVNKSDDKAEGDKCTRYQAVDSLIFSSLCQGVFNSLGSGKTGRTESWWEEAASILDGRKEELDKLTSHYSLITQHPGAAVNLYFSQNVPGYQGFEDKKNGTMLINTNVNAGHLRLLALWEGSKGNETSEENAKKLMAGAGILESKKLYFREDIFAEGAGAKLNSLGLSEQEQASLQWTVTYLKNWYDNISRTTQPVSGIMYQQQLDSVLKKKVGNGGVVEFMRQLGEASFEIPASPLKKQLQMVEGDKILALKEQFFGKSFARGTDTFRLDAAFIQKFAGNYGYLFGDSFVSMYVTGETGESLVEADGSKLSNYKDFILRYAAKLQAGNKKITLALSSSDTVEDRAAKLLLQKAVSAWEAGLHETESTIVGYLYRRFEDAKNVTLGQVLGMDDTRTDFNLRFKGTLLRWGYEYNDHFSLGDRNIDKNAIRFAGLKFRQIWANYDKDPTGRRELAALLVKHPPEGKSSEQVVEDYIKLMENADKDVKNLTFTSNNDSDLERALVFFVRYAAPNFSPPAEGEAETNIVDLPLLLYKKVHNGNITTLSFGETSGTAADTTKAVETFGGRPFYQPAYHGLIEGAEDFLTKNIQFGVFMHPTIQLSLQAGFLARMAKAAAAGDGEYALESLKELAKLRAGFFAFQYNPFALLRNGVNDIEEGNVLAAFLDLKFGFDAAVNLMKRSKFVPIVIGGMLIYSAYGNLAGKDRKYLRSGLELAAAIILLHQQFRLLRQFIPQTARAAWNHEWRRLVTGLEDEMAGRIMREQRLYDQNTPEAEFRKTKINLRRAAQSIKDLAIEPFTKSIQLIEKRIGTMPTFWKNMVHCAKNPNAIFEVEMEVPVQLPNGQPGTTPVRLRAKGWHLLTIYKHAIDPSLGARATQFTPVDKATRMNRITKLELRKVTAELARLNGGNRQIVESAVAAMNQEGQMVRQAGGYDETSGTGRQIGKKVFKLALQTDTERFDIRDLYDTMDRSKITPLRPEDIPPEAPEPEESELIHQTVQGRPIPEIMTDLRGGRITPERAAWELYDTGTATTVSDAARIFRENAQESTQATEEAETILREIVRGTRTRPTQNVTDSMIEENTPALAPTQPFNFESELGRLGIRNTAAFQGIDEAHQRSFVEAVDRARAVGKAVRIEIGPEVGFTNETIKWIVDGINAGDARKAIKFTAARGDLKIRVRGMRMRDGGFNIFLDQTQLVAPPKANSAEEPVKMSPKTAKAWAEYDKLVRDGKINAGKALGQAEFAKYYNGCQVFEKGIGFLMTVVIMHHIAHSDNKIKAVTEVATGFALFMGAMKSSDLLVGKFVKHPLYRFAADMLIATGYTMVTDKPVNEVVDSIMNKVGVQLDGTNWEIFGNNVGYILDVLGAGNVIDTAWNAVSKPDNEREFLDRSAATFTKGGRTYLNNVGEWNTKVAKEIAVREAKLSGVRSGKVTSLEPRAASVMGGITYVNVTRPLTPEEIAKQTAQISGEIKEWQAKRIDDNWDRRQAFDLNQKMSSLKEQQTQLIESANRSTNLSGEEKNKLLAAVQHLDTFGEFGFLQVEVAGDIYKLAGKAGGNFEKLFRATIKGYKSAADDFAFYNRIGRTNIVNNWRNEDYLKEEVFKLING